MNYILIVDDRFVARSGTSILLENELESALVFEVHNFREAIVACHTIIFDLVILDVDSPFGRKCKMIDVLRNMQKDAKIVLFSTKEENVYALRYLKAGVSGFLSKLGYGTAIVKSVENVLKLGKSISMDNCDKLIAFPQNGDQKNPLENLTQREFEIAVLLVRGLKNFEIANMLDLQITTVRTRKFIILKKLNITNVVELAELFEPLSEPLLRFPNISM